MRSYSIMLATLAAAAVASCGSDNTENLSANVQALDADIQNVMADESTDANAGAPIESAMPVPGANVQEKEVYRDREPPRPAPQPKPKAEPPADPHAGHDMGNMANMQH